MSNPHKFMDGVSESFEMRGRTYWRPAIALPLFTPKGLPIWKRFSEKNWRPECVCGQIFQTLDEYNDHYRTEAESNEVVKL